MSETIEEKLMKKVDWVRWKAPMLLRGPAKNGWTEETLVCRFCSVICEPIDLDDVNDITKRFAIALNTLKSAFEGNGKKPPPNPHALDYLARTPEDFALHLKEAHDIEVTCPRCSDYGTSILDPFDKTTHTWRCTRCQTPKRREEK